MFRNRRIQAHLCSVSTCFSEGYNCKLCHAELSNTYLHCLGCESLLSKDFNICLTCFKEERYYVDNYMGSKNKKARCDLNHTGQKEKRKKKRGCSCRQGVCPDCKFCKSCSCRCHHNFQHRRRFFESSELQGLLDSCEEICRQAGGTVSEAPESSESTKEQEPQGDLSGPANQATGDRPRQPVSTEEVQGPP